MTTPPPVDRRYAQAARAKPASKTGLFIGIAAGLLVVALVVIIAVIAVVGLASKKAYDKEAMARFQDEAQRIKSEINPNADLSDPANAKKVDDAIDRMADAAGTVDERMKAMVRVVMEELVAIGKEASGSTSRLMAAGGINPDTLTSRDAATKRIALLEKEQAVADATLQRVKNINQTARDAASRNGLSTKEAEAFVRGMNGKGKLDRLARVREIDTQLFRLFVKSVTLLRDNSGAWQVEDGKVIFSDLAPGVADRYNTLAREIGQLSNEQNSLVQEISENR